LKRQRLQCVRAIRERALNLVETDGHWEKRSGPDLKVWNDGRFEVGFYINPPSPTPCGLYRLDLWAKDTGKVLSLAWDSVGADPEIISFKRGDWEALFLDAAH
jgi:hypothetical protein